ncbi:hypothetical protein SAMN04488066_102264 [Halorubrum aquaticum]|uniref:Uncharacterized protein n=1 Tax=Halorubrum aquaticum TaxID=387340 RepID=A0A1I2ZLW8_9EURY|nr:hypothetical protein [Halorubrum aquaticum]SFH38813.1 hypothetical protein SAMN04488066_102264 [Halorubrum aquaticum]
MDRRRVALLLVVVGLLCLPAPQYLGLAAEATSSPARTSQVYAAEPVDLEDESDRERFVDRYGDEVAIGDYRLAARHADEYRSVNATRRALESAMATGSATVSDAGARADLRAIADEYAFLHDTDDGTEGYYRLRVAEDGSSVRAEPVSLAPVADAVAEEAPRYEDLSDGERRTVDGVLNGSTEADPGHRPRADAPYVDRFPTPIWKGDTLYGVYVTGHVDDFGPGFSGFVVGLGVAAAGVVALCLGIGLYVYDRRIG